MTREEKASVIAEIESKLDQYPFFYVTDSSTLTVEQVNKFRSLCHKNGIVMQVLKNTLVRKAMETRPADKKYDGVYESLAGPTAILFSENAKTPALILKEFREKNAKPVLKAAYIDTDVFVGDDSIELLTKIKSKEELVGEIIALLQSPAKNVISALKSGGSTIAGLVKALEERGQ